MPSDVLDAISDAGLFAHAVLVGTLAYICYSPIIGTVLPAGALTTQDADPPTASPAIGGDGKAGTMLDILELADETFAPVPAPTKGAPTSSFVSSQGFRVDLLTPQRRRSDTSPVRAVALHGSGVPVRVPQPVRFAVHKLIVAQKRGTSCRNAAKTCCRPAL